MRDKVMGPDQTAKFGPVRITGGAPMAWRNLPKYAGCVTFFLCFLFLFIFSRDRGLAKPVDRF